MKYKKMYVKIADPVLLSLLKPHSAASDFTLRFSKYITLEYTMKYNANNAK
jgi:hypothetical protein